MPNNRLFAIGDIHGCFNQFYKLIFDEIKLTKEDQLVLLGDYIDRGDQVKEVIDLILQLIKDGFKIIPLKGNHEELLIQAYQNPQNIPKWILNGGQNTLDSCGIKEIKDLPLEYIQFYRNLKPYFSIQDYLFVHAGFNDTILNPFDDEYHMLWTCNRSYKNPLLSNKTIIHGHCPITLDACKTAVNNKDKVINIDTGCVYKEEDGYGTLTAYDCNSYSLHFA